MALTMTRTRTQTTLTKLVTQLARINGELETLPKLLGAESAYPDELLARYVTLQQAREALIATIRQFDPRIDSNSVGTEQGLQSGMKPRAKAGGGQLGAI